MAPRLAAAALAAALLLPASGIACDAEEMNRHLNAVCHAALSPARAAIEGVAAHATEAERALIARALARADVACDTGDPRDGAAIAALLSRLAGRIEARAGIAAPLPELASRI